MAPVNVCSLTLNAKDKIKLRKPAVEKMRRDRINSSIEQLKALLHKEVQAHQPNSKLEKADILETAVLYLRDSPVHAGAVRRSYAEGFTQCLEETLRFLSAHNQPAESQRNLVSHFHRFHRTTDATGSVPTPNRSAVVSIKDSLAPKRVTSSTSGRAPVWRPW